MKTAIRNAGLLVGAALALSPQAAQAQDAPATCPPAIRAELEKNLTATPDVVAAGKKSYEANCVSCHGEKGLGDGAAAVALNPKPRNFSKEAFVNGSDPLAIFGTLQKGLNQGMPAFESLPADERWALVHYVREGLMPEDRRAKVDMSALDEICVGVAEERNRLPPVPVNLIMQIMAEETGAARNQPRDFGGVVKLSKDVADANGQVAPATREEGKALFGAMCAACHGDSGQGVPTFGQYGRAPYITLSTRPMTNHDAGGAWDDFSARAGLGAHLSLSDMTTIATLSESDWFALQAHVASFQGGAKVTNDAPPAAPPAALLYNGEGYDLFVQGGKVFQLVTNSQEPGDAPLVEVTDYATFRGLYKTAELPEAPPEGGVELPAYTGLPCIGQRTAPSADARPGCVGQDLSAQSPANLRIALPLANPTP